MTLLFAYKGNEQLAHSLVKQGNYELGVLAVHHFPDGESLVKLMTNVKGRDVVLLCSLDHPDEKSMTLMFFAETARELGAKSVGLIAPYLGYMRQDKRFHAGEAVTSDIFAAYLSRHFDSLVTVDPHLHRHKTMNEIYRIPTEVVHAAGAIAAWIRNNIKKPLLIGPDEESEQWLSDVAQQAGAPYIVLTKVRHGDKNVDISVPDTSKYKGYTPVLIDDIISTANTMISTINHLKATSMPSPVCIGIHAVFAGASYEALQATGPDRIVTCNTIAHPSNNIDISQAVATSFPPEFNRA